jgi:hypothetical protein
MRAALTLAALALAGASLLGCDTFERQVITVRLDRETEDFEVSVRLENAGAYLFGCGSDAEGCAGDVQAALALEGDSPLARRLRALAGGGARELSLALGEREGELDVLIHYLAMPGSGAADATGVALERELRPSGRVRTYLVTEHPGAQVEGGRYRTRIRYEDDSTPETPYTELVVSQVFSPRVDEVTLTVEDQQTSGSLLVALPGLDEALRRRGLL